ncbi:MAG: FHA domain-containing protein [Myxococcales bacterium]|nr:FHA domain-containing protein [Myxococcales bacterium]
MEPLSVYHPVVELKIVNAGSVAHTVRIATRPLSVGRAPDNDLILTSAQVSSHHALFYREHDTVHLRDLGSTNGSFVNDERVTEATLKPGDVVRLGDIELHCVDALILPMELQIRQVDGPVAWTVEDGFPLPDHERSMVFVEPGGVVLEVDGHSRALTPGVVFELDGRRYELAEVEPVARTVPMAGAFPYRLDVDLSEGRARLTSDELQPAVLTASTRVSLLYVLAGQPGDWIDDEVVGAGVWGRAWTRHDPNNLNVLLHRIRQEVGRAGYDKRFIERRRGAMRLRVREAHAA